MSGLVLFPDQVELLDETRQAMRRSKSVLMQASTGFGKTIVSMKMFQGLLEKGKTGMIVVPRRELLNQVSNSMNDLDIQHGFIASGMPFNPHCSIHVATTETLVRRLDVTPDKDLVVYDESHYGAASLGKIIDDYKKRNAWSVGLTATPTRTDGRGLGVWFDVMVCGKPVSWLIEHKRLSEYRLFAPDRPDLTGCKTEAQIADKMEQDRVLIGRAVDHYKKHAFGKLNITFGTSRKHSQLVNQSFLDAGVPSAYVDGETPEDERTRIFKALARREIFNVTSVDLLCFGFDLSSAAGMPVTIESMSDLQPTASLARQMQKYGRVLRMKDFPATIFDHAGNVYNHGYPDDERNWTLDSLAKKDRISTEKVLPIRQCPKCDFAHRPAPRCPNCGFDYPVNSREIEEVEGELVETKAQIKAREIKDKKKEQGMARTVNDLIALGEKRGMNNPREWALRVYKGRMRK